MVLYVAAVHPNNLQAAGNRDNTPITAPAQKSSVYLEGQR